MLKQPVNAKVDQWPLAQEDDLAKTQRVNRGLGLPVELMSERNEVVTVSLFRVKA